MSSQSDAQEKIHTLTIQLPNWAWFKLFLVAFFSTEAAAGMLIVLGIPTGVAGVIWCGHFTHWLVSNGFLYKFGNSTDGAVFVWSMIQLAFVIASICGICAAAEACDKVKRQLHQQQAKAQKQKQSQQEQEKSVQVLQ